jgi:hypothetical protein
VHARGHVGSARRPGPDGVQTGPPIESEDDERIEYRQVIADLLGDFAPSRWGDDAEDCTSEQETGGITDGSEIVRALRDDLTMRHPECDVLPVAGHHIISADGYR